MSLLHQLLSLAAQISPPDISVLPQTPANNATIQKVLRVVFTILGAIAVMMVVIGGIKYATSQGNPQETSKAKNTIIYALVGLIIAIFAVAIVDFVFGRVA